jgi:hypothetical protein
MSPEEIHATVQEFYPALTAEARTSPDGWSFFQGPKCGSSRANRIFRATRSSGSAPTKLKLAITSRLTQELELSFRGTEEELRYLIDRELRLWHTRLEKACGE